MRRRDNWWRNKDGYVALWGVLIFFVLALLAVALTDVYHLEVARAALHQVAGEAALVGASQGRDWAHYTATGYWALNGPVTHAAAERSARASLARHDIVDYDLQVAVLPEPMGGAVPGFPPVARAGIGDVRDWSAAEPAVGVYIAADVPTFFFGYVVAGTERVTVHAFQAAGVADVR